jgi:hypothetical protein
MYRRIEPGKHQANGQSSSRLPPNSESGTDQLLPKITFRNGSADEKAIICDHLSSESDAESKDTEAATRYHFFVASRGGEISFEDFVEFHNFDNKEVILALCSRSRMVKIGIMTSREADGKHTVQVGRSKGNAESKNGAFDQIPPTSPPRGNEQARDTLERAEETGRMVASGLILGTGAGRPTRVWRGPRSRVVDIVLGKQRCPSLQGSLYVFGNQLILR